MGLTPCTSWSAKLCWIHACTKENTAAPLHVHDMYLHTYYEQFVNKCFMLFEGKDTFVREVHC